MSAISDIRRAFVASEPGVLFTVRQFLALGKRAAVDQALSRLAKEGVIRRIARGVYVRDLETEVRAPKSFDPEAIVKAVAHTDGSVIQLSGKDVLARLGLQASTSRCTEFSTNGAPRRFHLAEQLIRVKKVSPRKVFHPESRAGLALAALWFYGRSRSTVTRIQELSNVLSQREYAELLSMRVVMPGWMSDAIHEFERHRFAAPDRSGAAHQSGAQ